METRSAYRAKFDAQLEQAQARLAQMKATVKERMADEALTMSARLEELEKAVAEAKARLEQINAVHDEKWEDFKAAMEAAWEKVTARFGNGDHLHPAAAPAAPAPTQAPAERLS